MRIELTLDCGDLAVAADFWSAALGYSVSGTIEDKYVTLSGDGPSLQLQRVPEAKGTKNRLHLDLFVADVEAEVRRLEELGATRVTPTANVQFGHTWHVLADPDGNEFCVARDSDGAAPEE